MTVHRIASASRPFRRVTMVTGSVVLGIALLAVWSGPAWAPPPPSPPGPATSVTVTPGNGQATVSWQEYFDMISGYIPDTWVAHVPRAKGGNSCSVESGQFFPFSTDSCTIVGLTNGTHYVVAVYPLYTTGGRGPGGQKERRGVPSKRVKVVPGP
jgi:hypothetical protein